MSLATLTDTIVAVSTPLATSALATIRLSGPDSIAIIAKCVDRPEKIITSAGGNNCYVNVLDEDGNAIDDVVITIWRAPRSYSGEDIVEVHSHGSVVIIDRIQKLLIAAGARLAEAGEFSRRAFSNGKIGLKELERTLMRLDASSESALSKIDIFLSEKFARLRGVYDDILSILARVNAVIDFGESDEVDIDGFSEESVRIITKLQQLQSKSINEQLNKGYYSIALTGSPNVGKSSLFNLLLRYERSIVSEIPGTTRDYVEAFILLNGFRVKLIDTAGIRQSSDVIESQGIALGSSVAARSDFIFRLTEPSSRGAKASADEVIVHNKCDIDGFKSRLSVSVTTGEGIDNLVTYIQNEISKLESTRTGYSFTSNEIAIIQSVIAKLARLNISNELALIAEDLRACADEIGGLFGLNVSEDNLNYIFHKMCIGK